MKMECIKYINDLAIEIEILKDLVNEVESNNDEILERINRKTKILEKCKTNLEKFSSDQVCYRIYVKVLNGYSLSKAIEKVAEENYLNNLRPCHPYTLWKNYYPKMKKILEI